MMNMTSWLHKFKIFVFALLFFMGERLWADHQSGDIVSYLRDLAARLGWSQEVFASVKSPGEDYQVFGIADRAFYELNEEAEKGYAQWLLALHPSPLEKVLQKHLRTYRRQGFKIASIESVGNKMYRAYLASYLVKDGKLILARSQDAIEILFGPELLTLKDERLKLDADAWAIFEEVYELSSKEGIIQNIPKSIPSEPSVKTPFEKYTKEISVLDLFPKIEELPDTVSQWKITQDFSKDARGEILVEGRTYQKLPGGVEKNASSIQVVFYAYPSVEQAQHALRLYRKKLRDVLIDTPDKKGFWIFKEGSMKVNFTFTRGIFICDLELNVLGKPQEEKKKSLEEFSNLIQEKIKKFFPI